MTFHVAHVAAAEADAGEWLAALNLCFPGWGGRDRFAWCFGRAGAGRLPDALFLSESGRTLGGIGLVYRSVGLADGRRLPAAVITGAWTRPEARGRGVFEALVRESRAAAAARGAALVLGFVTASNASRRVMERVGSELFPTFYGRSRGADRPPAALADLGTERLDAFRPVSTERRARFVYDGSEWAEQFVGRPGGVRVLGEQGRFAAVVEDGPDLRILALAAAPGGEADACASLAASAAESGSAAFTFTTRAALAEELRAGGYELADGFVTTLPAGAASLAEALGVEGEDAARRLLDWDLQNGDRM